MKKITCIFLGAIFGTSAIAQVGIDTETPQQQLHISGEVTTTDSNGVVGPTIRIDGLAEANNNAYTAGESIQPVYANSNGDLVLHNNSSFGYIEGSNGKDDDLTSVIASYVQGDYVTTTLKEINFTLDSKALVHFNKSISLNIALNNDSILSDGIVRLVDVAYQIISAPDTSLNGKFIAIDGIPFSSSTDSPQGPSGYILLNGAESVILPEGDYEIRLVGRLIGNPQYIGEEQAFMVQFGGFAFDEVSIIAEPWPY